MKTTKMLILTAWITLGFGACGGKTLGDGSNGGSSNGGSSGSGGSLGGSGGSGGSVGGSAGFGGTVGGSGGVGGSVGGSGGSGGSGGDWQAAIKQLCGQLATIPCGMPIDECTQQLYEGVQESENFGCGALYKALIQCAASHPLSCEPGQNEPVLSPECAPLVEDLSQCMEGPTPACGGSGGPGFCEIFCDTWSAQCKEDPSTGALSCFCSSGPKSGVQFSVAGSCGGSWHPVAEQMCAP